MEESPVLDCDDGLVGEALQQGHLRRRELSSLAATNDDRAYCFASADEWSGEDAAKATAERLFTDRVFGVLSDLRQLSSAGPRGFER